jgi:hypothetical protein
MITLKVKAGNEQRLKKRERLEKLMLSIICYSSNPVSMNE